MNDLWMIAATLGFFALCAAYVALCDRIVGPDEIELPTSEPADEPTSGSTGDPVLAAHPVAAEGQVSR